METKEQQGSEPIKSTYEAFSMQDRVRSDILDRQRDLIDAIKEVDITAMRNGGRIQEDEPKVIHLKANVMALYSKLKDKLNYPKYPEMFRPLRNLSVYSKGLLSVNKLTLKDAKFYADLMNTFIEVDGITKFEREKDDTPPEYIMAKRAKGIVHGTVKEDV